MDVKTYMVDPTSGMCIIPRGHLEGQEYEMVLVEDFDRVTTERDALQRLLNARDEEVDRLRGHILCLLAGANAEMHESWKCNSYHPLLTRAVSDAEKALENQA